MVCDVEDSNCCQYNPGIIPSQGSQDRMYHSTNTLCQQDTLFHQHTPVRLSDSIRIQRSVHARSLSDPLLGQIEETDTNWERPTAWLGAIFA